MNKILVFGTFDGLHEGHLAFLRQARTGADGTRTGTETGSEKVWLTAVVARDETVELLKGQRPIRSLNARMKELKDFGLVDEVVAGDEKIGRWEVIGKHNPHVIVLGYDQNDLRTALLGHIRQYDLETEVRVAEGHEPDQLHSSLLNKE